MPELPEVETIKRGLEAHLLGKKITQICVHHPKVVRQPSLKKFKEGLAGATIKNILRKAKVLIIEFSNGRAVTIHLKMTGQLIYPGGREGSRLSFCFSDGTCLDYFDQRLFGELRLVDDWRQVAFIKGLGPEPFAMNPAQFKEMLARKKTKIKPLLMDQRFICGIGNLYAAEALFRARINPGVSAASLSDKKKGVLFKEMVATLREAILHQGSSVDNYVRLDGTPGGYVDFHQVYARAGKPCRVCKTKVKRISLGGRGTYFCPRCQKAP
ncbi:MAG: DNA-formamidopyrimidine glycosylase [Candidatus Omnitrophica bacterium]|nr:DNA-formamidopyrimidine glycosylase [Candidatus Omnitrophota bacterium]